MRNALRQTWTSAWRRAIHDWIPGLKNPPLLAIPIGCACGLAATVFHHALAFLQEHILNRLGGYPFADATHPGPLPPALFFIIPTLGGLAVGLLIHFVVPEAEGPGTDGLVKAFHEDDGKIRARVPLGKGAATLLTLSTGGSAGQEGPIAQIGGGIGSEIGRWLNVSPETRRILMLTGTAGGLGAIFQAPLGGALTACEILYRKDFESEAFQPAVIASVVGFAIYRLAIPTGPFLDVGSHSLLSWREMAAATILGLALVPFSLLFTRILAVIKLIFQSTPMPAYLKPALGGALFGLIGMAMPEAIGPGWDVVTQVATGSHTGGFLLLVLLVKMVTTTLTLGSGGSGGLFGPCLFLGTLLGGVFGWAGQSLFPTVFTDPSGFALVGMGAFFAGAAKAPLAGIVMVCEMTGNYGLLPALLLAGATHYGLSSSWTIYPAQRLTRKHSPAHRLQFRTESLGDISVAECLDWEAYPDTLHPETPLAALDSAHFRSNPHDWPVVDESGRLCGLLRVHHLLEALGNPLLQGGLLVEDVMEPPVFLTPVQDLSSAMDLFQSKGLYRIPVLDAEGRLIGSLNAMHLVRARENSTHS